MGRYDIGLPILAKGPEFYKSAEFRCPNEYTNTPFQQAFHTDLGFYEYLSRQPETAKNFHIYMSALQQQSPSWVDWFPVQQRVIDHVNSDPRGSDVLLVDIGGGEGHYIKRFREKFPHAPGRFILQDLHRPDGKDGLGDGIEWMKHSFFDPQPVKGKITITLHPEDTMH